MKLSARRSTRHFTEDALPQEAIETIIADASWAPSGGNDQPWAVSALGPTAALQLRQRFEDRAWRALRPKLRRMVARDADLAASELDKRVSALVEQNGRVRGAPWALLVHFTPEPSDEVLSGDEAHMIHKTEPVVRRDSVVCFAHSLCLAATQRGYGSCMQSMYDPFAGQILEWAGAAGAELVSVVLVGNALSSGPRPPRRQVPLQIISKLTDI